MMKGTTLNKITNLNDLLQRAAGNLVSRVDPPDTMRIAQISNAVHNDIYDYSCPSDLKGKKVADIRPQINRGDNDQPTQRFSNPFDLEKKNNTFAISYNSGEKILRLSKAVSPSAITLHDMNSITANGTWAVGGDATNLTADSLDYISGNASMNFDFTGSATTGWIRNLDMDAKDLSDEEDIGRIWVRVYLPATSNISSITLRWGSSSAAYWSATATSPHDATAWKTGWNIVAFDWNGATETGSPDSSAIDYLRVIITVTTAAEETDFRVDKISCSRGEIFEIVYYSECLFKTSGGTWQTTTSADSDIINLDTDGFNLYLYECAMEAFTQLQGPLSPDVIGFQRKLGLNDVGEVIGGLYAKYQRDHPSEAKKPIDQYYNPLLYG